MKEESIYNGVTMSEFIAATKTLTAYLGGVCAAPQSDRTEVDLLFTGLWLIPVLESHNAFCKRLEAMKGVLEARKHDPTDESAHITGSAE